MISFRTSQRPVLRWILFVLAAVVYLYPFLRLGPGVSDEGEHLTDAVRILHGQVFSRDFFEAMAPGTPFFLALFFKLFGITWLARGISVFLTSVSSAAILYYLALRLKITFSAGPLILFAAASFGLLWPAVSHHGDSNLFALLSFAIFLHALDRRRPALYVCAGAMAGIASCFMQQKGLLLGISFGAAIWLLDRRTPHFRMLLLCLAAGYTAVGVFCCALFYRAGVLGSLIYANVVYPLTHYGAANSVPYAMGILNFYWPLWSRPLASTLPLPVAYSLAVLLMVPFVFVAALPLLLTGCALKLRGSAFDRFTLPYWLCGTAVWLSELQRKDIWHLVYGSPLLILLCFYLLHHLPYRWTGRGLQLITICGCVLAACNLLVVSTARTPIATRRGTVYGYRPDPVLEYLNAHIRPGEGILAYPFRPAYYFLLDANNVTKYTFYMRGMHGNDVFQSAVDALESGKVKHVIWDTTYEDPSVEWAFPVKFHASMVETYLAAHYSIIYKAKGIRLLERKD